MKKPIPLTREEKEREVIELYKQGANFRQIAKRVHLSFSDIARIIRKFLGEDKLERPKKYSRHSEALELFQNGNSLLEVAKKLDLTDSQTMEEYNQYMRLIGLNKFCELYEQMNGNLESLLSLHQELELAGVSATEAIQGVTFARQLDHIKLEIDILLKKLSELNVKIQNSLLESARLNQLKNSLQREIKGLEETKNNYRNQSGSLPNDVMAPAVKTQSKRIKRRHRHKGILEKIPQTADINNNCPQVENIDWNDIVIVPQTQETEKT